MHIRAPSGAVRSRRAVDPRRAGALIGSAGLITVGLAVAGPSGPASAVSLAAAASVTSPVPPPQPHLPLSGQRLLGPPPAVQLPGGVQRACPPPARAGEMQCMSLLRTNTRHRLGVVPDQGVPGYGPAQLQSAYNLTSTAASGGVGETVAVVAAYDDPNAASDLAVYRAEYGLPACNPTTGSGCLTTENESGQATPLPPTEPPNQSGQPQDDWEATESVDLDMVSAICPNCRILLVEANSALISDLGPAENTASSQASFIANSWDSGEFASEDSYDKFFDHPGVAITVSAGYASSGSGYGPTWPTTSQFVTAVGGTTLTQDPGTPRGWTETAYSLAGSGCSLAEPKPSWQTMDASAPAGCLNRTQNDVAAVADPATGVAMYDSYGEHTGWTEAGGTSVSAPIIAAVYALAGPPPAGTYPASYPYQSGHTADLYDVTAGSNGTCEPNRQYLCNAEPGYDGPTGLGTPDGTAAFANSAASNLVTITDPGTEDLQAGTPVFIAMQSDDSAGLALKYSATGLPPGLTIGTGTGRITGTLSNSASTSTVTVTATDISGAAGKVTFTIVVAESLRTGYHVVSGPVALDLGGKCLDDYRGSTSEGAVVDEWACNGSPSQNWEYVPDGNPGGAGTFIIHSRCLDLKGGQTALFTPVVLNGCNGKNSQQWMIAGSEGELYSPDAKLCLADPGGDLKNGRQLWVWNCDNGLNQAWIPSGSPVQSGVAGHCVDDSHDSTANGNKIQIWDCLGNAAQKWTDEPDQTLRLGGKCMTVSGASALDGATVVLEPCGTTRNQQWVIGNGGELINVNSGRCLTDPGNSSTEGTGLVQEDCYGLPGQIWAVT